MAGEQEVGVGLVFVAAHPAAELIEIAQAKAVGAVYDDGVGIGDVQAAFDEGGGEQDIGAAVDEGGHDFLQAAGFHPAVADGDAGMGQERAQAESHGLDVQNAVVQIKNLAAAVKFALDGVAHGALVVGGDDGLDGQTVLGRSFNGAHVARAGQSEVEGAGDGGGGQGQDIHGDAELFESFLVQDAKTLLFINDDQTQTLEGSVALQKAVGADADVPRAGGELADGACQFAP